MRRLAKIAVITSTSAIALAATQASAATIGFTPQANIFAAGLSTIPFAGGGEGVLPPSLTVTGGQTLVIALNGSGNPGGGYPTSNADGFTLSTNITNATGSTIGNWTSARALNVLGVYTGTGAGVNTIFAIGTGGNFVVPTGATSLYLGFADAFAFDGTSGYYADNTGEYVARINGAVPEPATWAMMIAGFGIVGGAMRVRRQRVRFAAA